MRGIADLQEAALIVPDVRPELVTTGKLLTRTALAPFEEQEDSQPEEAMEQNPDLAGKDDDKATVGGALSLDFKLLDENEEGTETLAGTTESENDKIFSLEPLSALAFVNAAHNLPELNYHEKKYNGISTQEKSKRRRPTTFLGNSARSRVRSSPPRS